MSITLRFLSLLCLGLAINQPSFAIGEAAKPLQHQWAIVKYQTAENERERAFEQLAKQAGDAEQQYPGNAEVIVWEAIILSTYAGEKGGLGALGLVKQAKQLLERAEALQPEVLDGSVYTSLGSLYYQVPGWPIGFGDDDKAEQYLKKALALNPDGIDANYFYGDFLLEQGHYRKATEHLKKALSAPTRPGREVADAGRRVEISAKLEQAETQLQRHSKSEKESPFL